jgi:PAS domain S-box-containing protein
MRRLLEVFPSPRGNGARAYAAALGFVAGAQMLRWLVELRWPIDRYFLFYHLAVAGAALAWGFGPGVAAVAASALAAAIFHDAAPSHLFLFTVPGLALAAVSALARRHWRGRASDAVSRAHNLNRLVDALPQLVAYIDADQRYRFNNRAYQEWFGFRVEELTGRHMRDVLGEEAYEVVRPHVEAALAGREVTYEAYAPYKSGGGRHIEARYVPFRPAPDGLVRGFFVLVSDISERRRAAEQLEARAAQQEAVARLGQDALRSQDLETLFRQTLDGVCSTLGTRHGAILELTADGRWSVRASCGWDGDPGWGQCSHTLARGEPVIMEDAGQERRFDASGAVRHGVRSGLSVLIDAHAGRWGVLSAHDTRPRAFSQDDIHFMQAVAHLLSAAIRRTAAERTVRESEERFRMLADTAPVMIWVADAHNGGLYFNRPWLEFTGRTLEQELGVGWTSGVHPDDRDASVGTCAAAFEERRPFRTEFRLRRHDGAWRWVLDHGIPRFDRGGNFLGYIGSVVDITDRRHTEHELQRSLEQLAAIYEVSDVTGKAGTLDEVYGIALTGLRRAVQADRASILLFDPDGVMRFKAWDGLSESYRSRTSGHSPWTRDTVDPAPVVIPDAQDAPELGELRETILEEGIRSLGFVPLVAGGRLIGKFMVYYDTPHDFSEEELRLAATIGRHVASAVERHRREQELRTLNETLENRVQRRTREAERRAVQLRALALDLIETEERERRLLAQALHDDLQQILVAARMKVGQLLRSHNGLLQPVQDLLQDALQSSRRITLDLSPPILFETGLVPALEWLARHMRDKYGLDVRLEAHPGADVAPERQRAFLFRAARELLFNVVKHAESATASMLVQPAGNDAVALEVRDTGRGFQPITGSGAGATGGFGLFSIHERAEALGGRLEVHSAPGSGTRVRLVVGTHAVQTPAETAQALRELAGPPILDSDERLRRAVAGRIRVLLVDDHKIVREGLAALLAAQEDMETVAQAADGEEAVTLAVRLKPDVVVMDVSMPRLSGIEATRRITAQAPSVKVIGLSMFENEEMSMSMRNAGASAYLTKDRASETLCDLIRMQSREA